MPRYHFHLHDGHAATQDVEGLDLPDLTAARNEALEDACQLMAESDRRGLCRRHWRVDISDGHGVVLLTIPFSHALTPDFLPLGGIEQTQHLEHASL